MPSFDLGVIARGTIPAPLGSVNAVGGVETLTEENGIIYKVHAFTESGTITFIGSSGTVECFVLAGGGGGGFGGSLTSANGGGGGGGGLLLQQNIQIKVGIEYAITVGGGGATGTSSTVKGFNGSNSIAFGVTAFGGGGGGSSNSSFASGNNGGSGGGSGVEGSTVSSQGRGGSGFAGPPRQGFNGGDKGSSSGTAAAAGGGGGFSEQGAAGASTGNIGGKGGDGITSLYNGIAINYAGGGSGGNSTTFSLGGDYRIANNGAGGRGGAGGSGVKGSSGIVYIRYPFGFSGTGGTVVNYFESGTPYRAHVFTESGTAAFSNTGQIELLIVAGGGGGVLDAINSEPGGGGGGGLIYRQFFKVKKDIEYSIIVGAGGAPSVNGQDTLAFNLTALGGGRGASVNQNPNPAGNGGSGGGACRGNFPAGIGLQPTSASGGFGNNGSPGTSVYGGGGGGAATPGGQGSNPPSTGTQRSGGDGLPFALDGVLRYFSGGGGAEIASGSAGTGGLSSRWGGLGSGPFNFGGGGNTGPITKESEHIFSQGGQGVVIFRYAYFPEGQEEFTTPGTYSWTAPEGVTLVSVVAVGGGASGGLYSASSGSGGGLGWKNNISVVPGLSYTVVVGAGGAAVVANQTAIGNAGGNSYFINQETVLGGGGIALGAVNPVLGGTYVGDGGGVGGRGFHAGTVSGQGGGGAGGYTGAGGNAKVGDGGNGSGGGGGAGGQAASTGGGSTTGIGAGGGGVGIYGQGVNGVGGASNNTPAPGGGGSGGASGSGRNAGNFGAGGGHYRPGSSLLTVTSGRGGDGAVRIIWGLGRSFPNNAEDV